MHQRTHTMEELKKQITLLISGAETVTTNLHSMHLLNTLSIMYNCNITDEYN